MKLNKVLLGAVSMLAMPLLAQTKMLDVAVRGKAPAYSIVIHTPTTKPMESAANEFQSFVQQMTGVTLPIVLDDKPLPNAAVLIGDTTHSKKLLGAEYNLAELKDDAFKLKAVGPHIVVLGGKRGGQYGAYELLERFGGCRWYSSWHSKIPTLDAFSIPADLNETQKPAFLMREPFWFDMFNTYQALRNKCNGNRMNLTEDNGGKITFGGGLFVHTLGVLVPVSEFYATHPEYFSEIKGRRIKDRTQVCLSNPDVLKIVTERVLQRIRKNPTGTMYSVSQNDWYNPCECEKCKAIIKQTGNQAGIMIWFVNQVAEAVEKEFPNALIETLAYQYTREPPANIKPRHNVVPRLCTIECDFAHPIRESTCPENIKFTKDIEGWASISKQLYIWDYVTNFSHYTAPYPNFRSLQGNVKLFRDCHVLGVMEQGAYQAYHGDFAELKGWILAKLLWNPDQDVNVLLDDFMNGYYGAAAPFVRQYFDELHALVDDPNMYLKTFNDVANKPLTDAFLKRGTELWAKAEAAVKDQPNFLYNVKCGAMTVHYATLSRMSQVSADYKWEDDKLVPSQSIVKQSELAQKILECFENPYNRPILTCEGRERNQARVNYWKSISKSLDVHTLENSTFKMSMAPGLGGTLGILRSNDGFNYLNSNEGGIVSGSAPFQFSNFTGYNLASKTSDSLSCQATFNKNAVQTNEYKLLNDGTLATFKIANTSDKKIDYLQNLVFAFSLDIDANVCFKVGNGEWNEISVPSNYEYVPYTFDKDAFKAGNVLHIASPKSKRGIDLLLPEGNFTYEKMTLHVAPDKNAVKIILFIKHTIPAKGSVSQQYTVKPIAKTGVIASSIPFKVQGNEVRITRKGTELVIGHIGSWGEYDTDYDSEEGFAAKLFNTHFEWCLQTKVNFEELTPGVKYDLRFHIKVIKKEKKGEAFWAGLYNTTQAKDIGSFSIDVSKIPDEKYHWYTVATWTPDTTQNTLIWAGPGRFTNGISAIKYVYIDKFEIVPSEK